MCVLGISEQLFVSELGFRMCMNLERMNTRILVTPTVHGSSIKEFP